MRYRALTDALESVGKDPSRLIFEDELTGIHNRRFLLSYLDHRVHWESGNDYPLSLLFMDVDHFKQVNDTHGHEVGDQMLTWLALLLKAAAGEDGLPIRYSGDEFILLAPGTPPSVARQVAEQLLQQCKVRAFRLRDSGVVLPVNLSIGVASAPEDARDGKTLIHRADTALYHAKRSGRSQAVSAAEIDVEKVFPKTALHRLKSHGVAGREKELAAVSTALDGVGVQQSRFLILEGAAGMGKTALLETVRRNLAGNGTFRTVKVAGVQQEAYRPYYLATSMLVALLNQRTDRGAEILRDLTAEQAAYLVNVLPQLEDEEGVAAEKNPSVNCFVLVLTHLVV